MTTTRKKKKYYNDAARSKVIKRIDELVSIGNRGPLDYNWTIPRWKRAAQILNEEFGDNEDAEGWRTRYMRWIRARANKPDVVWGAHIRSAYKNQGMTLDQLASKVGITARVLSDRIRAVTPWKPDERRRLEEWLGQDNQGRAVNGELNFEVDDKTLVPPGMSDNPKLIPAMSTEFRPRGKADLIPPNPALQLTPLPPETECHMLVDVQAAVKILGDEWSQHRRRGRNWVDPKVIPMALSCLTGRPIGHYYQKEEDPDGA